MKLYDASAARLHQDNVKELRKESKREGMEGMSPRYVQDKISMPRQRHGEGTIILHGAQRARKACAPLAHLQRRDAQALHECIGLVKQEYEDIVKNEVQRAISADEETIARLAANYIDNVKAFTLKEKSDIATLPRSTSRTSA